MTNMVACVMRGQSSWKVGGIPVSWHHDIVGCTSVSHSRWESSVRFLAIWVAKKSAKVNVCVYIKL